VTIKLTFIFGGIFLFTARMHGKEAPDAVRWIFRWAKRAFPIGATVYWISEAIVNGPLNGWDAIIIVLDWWNYRGLKDEDDDDFWKRAKDKVTEVVKQVGDRLVIAPPEPATAGA
jgi:hypothetical protein